MRVTINNDYVLYDDALNVPTIDNETPVWKPVNPHVLRLAGIAPMSSIVGAHATTSVIHLVQMISIPLAIVFMVYAITQLTIEGGKSNARDH